MPNPLTWTLPADLEAAVSATLREWAEHTKVDRLCARADAFRRIADDARQGGFAHVLLLGMAARACVPWSPA
jgi:hypothetical protein